MDAAEALDHLGTLSDENRTYVLGWMVYRHPATYEQALMNLKLNQMIAKRTAKE
jgi:hypothetical protein